MSETVNVGACRCPGTPHTDGDTVELASRVPLGMGVSFMVMVNDGGNKDIISGKMGQLMLQWGIEGWSFVDDKGKPLPIEQPIPMATLERLMPFDEGGWEVAEQAANLYTDALMRPLLNVLSRRSQPGPTGVSMPQTRGSGSTRQKHSKRSSPNGMDGQPFVPVR